MIEKRAEFKAEAAEVSTTKFTKAAAHLIPMSWKMVTNGDYQPEYRAIGRYS